MSYDIHIGEDLINHTYNGCELCEEIIGFTPTGFDGMYAHDVEPLASKIYKELSEKGSKYEHYMPDNKWGTLETWQEFMQEIIESCKKYPDEIVKVD